jgi:hypothetical protein
MALFAPQFIEGRLVGFEKDMRICLTSVDSPDGKKKTVAYFPALAACCSTLEYFVGLHRGSLKPAGWPEVAAFANSYLRQPDFNAETVRVLFQAFRHPVAHRGIASGVWVDQTPGQANGRRLVWAIAAGTKRPACLVVAEAGTLRRDPPWPVSYTHRVHIHLGSLWRDIADGARQYAADVAQRAELQTRFAACMKRMYPI